MKIYANWLNMLSKSVVKYIQSLQHKKFRDANREFVVEGHKLVLEMLASGTFDVVKIYAVEDWQSNLTDKNLLSLVETISENDLQKISGMPSPNKVLAVLSMRTTEEPPDAEGLTLVLDDVRDPGNLGTIIRTADWFGVKHIICSDNTVDFYNPKVVQSTMGSLSRVNIYYTHLATYLKKNKDVPSYAAVLDGVDVRNTDKQKSMILVIGNEANGISPNVLQVCTHHIRIPGGGDVESLNAAIAAAILMYEFGT